MSQIKIAILSYEYPPNVNGGLGRYIERYTGYLLKHGHHLRVFSYNFGEYPRELHETRLEVYRPVRKLMIKLLGRYSLFLYNYDSYRILKKLQRENPSDIISVHDWMSSPAGILCCLRLKIPVVFHVHNTEFTMTPWGKKNFLLANWIGFFERYLARLASKIIVPSDKMGQLLANHGWDPKKIVVIQHGYESTNHQSLDQPAELQIKSKIYSQLRFHPDDKVLLFVGRLVYAKGIFYLIEALKTVVRAKPNTRLIMIGTGVKKTIVKMNSLIDQLGLTEHIYAYQQFLNHEQVYENYSAADICIFPSLYEPFGLVALEAMSLGKPVILGDGFPSFFSGSPPNTTALFVKSQDPQQIAAGIFALLDDPARAARMGTNARNFVRNHFNWDDTFQETLGVYSQIMIEAQNRE